MNAPTQAAPTPASPMSPAAAAPGRPAQVSQPTEASARASSTASAATAAIARADAIAAARPAPAAPAKPSTPVAASAPAAAAPVVAAEVHPWRAFFAEWPSQIPKRGILITRLNEASPFKAFMMRGDFLLIERVSPDSLGGRFLVIPFDEISTVKFTDPLKQPALEAAGFEGQLSL